MNDDNGSDSLSVVPISSVLGVISIKKTLRLSDFKDAVDNIKSVYSLKIEPLKNSYHYDMKLDPTLEFREGQILNKVFSCIFSFENGLLVHKVDAKETRMSEKESTIYIDKICKESWFDNMRIDLICSLDGTVFYPSVLVKEKNKFVASGDCERFGEPKQSIAPYVENDIVSHDATLVLSYALDFSYPFRMLGRFLTLLQFYCSRPVKSSVNFEKLLGFVPGSTSGAPMKERDKNKLIVKKKLCEGK